MKNNETERFFGGITLVALLIICEILSLLGLNVFAVLDKIPFLIGFSIFILLLVHFIPEKIYDYYENNPGLFYLIYFLEFIVLMILIFPCHDKYFS
ncbi:MAG: hypothetical protein IK102_10405 [Treponema sp.]|nr:hypothetical protein [Treponema sp.]